MKSLKLLLCLIAGQCVAQQDVSFVADVTGDNRQELVLINTSYNSGAILTVNTVSGANVGWVDHSAISFTGWMDAGDKMFMGDVTGDQKAELILVNTSYSGGAIRIVNPITGANVGSVVNHGAFGGWMDATDKMFLGDVIGDSKQELILVNTSYNSGAIYVIDLSNPATTWFVSHGSFGSWMDPTDRMFLGDVDGNGDKELVMVNTNYIGAAVRAVNPTNGNIVATVNPNGTLLQVSKDMRGWLDAADWIDVKDVNSDGHEDLVCVNTSYSFGAILALDIMTGAQLSYINHGTFAGWMDPCDRWFIADVDNNNANDLVMVNTAGSGGVIKAVNILSGASAGSVNYDGSYAGLLDNSDLIGAVKTETGNRSSVLFVNSANTAGSTQIRVVNATNSTTECLSTSGLAGWKDGWSYNCVGNNNPADFPNQFVYLQNNVFYNNGAPFYPKVLNYSMNLVSNDGVNFMGMPDHGYSSNNLLCCANQAAADVALNADMKRIADMGFNTIRLTGAAVEADSFAPNGGLTFYYTNSALSGGFSLNAKVAANQTKIFTCIQKVVDAARLNGLRVILLTGHRYVFKSTVSNDYKNYLSYLSYYFRNETGILGYDFINEPETNWNLTNYTTYTKEVLCPIVNNWVNAIKINAPQHLTTIGNMASLDIQQWDPSLLNVDFISFHIYPEQTATSTIPNYKEYYKSTIKWISSTITKPWIIGETGLSAINHTLETCPDHTSSSQNGFGTEAEQADFSDFSYNLIRNCNGAGYSFWTFHDVSNDNLPVTGNYEGLISKCQRVKPAAAKFFKDGTDIPCCSCPQPADQYYYNLDASAAYTITGSVKNASGVAIKDAIVIGKPNSGKTIYTKTKADGTFTIKSNAVIVRMEVTALGYSVHTNWVTLPVLPSTSAAYPQITLTTVGCNPNQLKTDPATAVSDAATENLVEIFPNPSSGLVNILISNAQNANIKVYDIAGKLLATKKVTAEKTQLDLSELTNGIYFISVEDSGKTTMSKIILNK